MSKAMKRGLILMLILMLSLMLMGMVMGCDGEPETNGEEDLKFVAEEYRGTYKKIYSERQYSQFVFTENKLIYNQYIDNEIEEAANMERFAWTVGNELWIINSGSNNMLYGKFISAIEFENNFNNIFIKQNP